MRPLLEFGRGRWPCSCLTWCSLPMAASVIGLYASVAYIIAFFIEIWWIWEIEGQVPYLGYVLTTAYLVTFLLSVILVIGISKRRISHLAVWMSGVVAILLPEAGLALFMGLQFWRVSTFYGLTEVTSWACRLTVNVVGLTCVQSLYSVWSEEKQVLSSLRDLNMASSRSTIRRSSISSINSIKSMRRPPDARLRPPVPSISSSLQRWGSSVSLGSHRSLPAVLPSRQGSEFDAFLFDTRLSGCIRGHPPEMFMMNGFGGVSVRKWCSLSHLPSTNAGRISTGYLTSQHDPPPNIALYPYQTSLFRPPPGSKASFAESDDTQRYKDVQL